MMFMKLRKNEIEHIYQLGWIVFENENRLNDILNIKTNEHIESFTDQELRELFEIPEILRPKKSNKHSN